MFEDLDLWIGEILGVSTTAGDPQIAPVTKCPIPPGTYMIGFQYHPVPECIPPGGRSNTCNLSN